MSIIQRSRVFFGRRMNSSTGKYLRKTVRIQFGILWVRGPRKFQFIITTVANIEMQFIKKVNSKYLAIKGSTNDVGGNILETSNKKTTNDSKIDMPKVTFSPARGGGWGSKESDEE